MFELKTVARPSTTGLSYNPCLVIPDHSLGGRSNGKMNNFFEETLFELNRLEKIVFGIRQQSVLIEKVIFNAPATIVYWADGSKTVVKAQNGEVFDKEKGLAMAIVKKVCGNKGNYNEIFKKHCHDEE